MVNAAGPLQFHNGYAPPRVVNNDGLPVPSSIWEKQSSCKKIRTALTVISCVSVIAGIGLVILSSVPTPIKLPILVNIPGALAIAVPLAAIPFTLRIVKNTYWRDPEFIASQRQLANGMTLEQILRHCPRNLLANDQILSRYDFAVKVHEYIERNHFNYSEALQDFNRMGVMIQNFIFNHVGMCLEKFAIEEIRQHCKNENGKICPKKIHVRFQDLPNPFFRGIISWKLFENDLKIATMNFSVADIERYIKLLVPPEEISKVLDERFKNKTYSEVTKDFNWNWIKLNCSIHTLKALIRNEFNREGFTYFDIKQTFGDFNIYEYIRSDDIVIVISIERMLAKYNLSDLVVEYGSKLLNIVKLAPMNVQAEVKSYFDRVEKACKGLGLMSFLKIDSKDIKFLAKKYNKDLVHIDREFKRKMKEFYKYNKIPFNPSDRSNEIDDAITSHSELIDGGLPSEAQIARVFPQKHKANAPSASKSGSSH